MTLRLNTGLAASRKGAEMTPAPSAVEDRIEGRTGRCRLVKRCCLAAVSIAFTTLAHADDCRAPNLVGMSHTLNGIGGGYGDLAIQLKFGSTQAKVSTVSDSFDMKVAEDLCSATARIFVLSRDDASVNHSISCRLTLVGEHASGECLIDYGMDRGSFEGEATQNED